MNLNEFSIFRKNKVDNVNFLEEKLLFPSNLCCNLRPLEDHPKYKASEFRAIILFGWIVLFKYLSTEFFDHFLLLVSAIHILSSPNIKNQENEIKKAKMYLEQFVSGY